MYKIYRLAPLQYLRWTSSWHYSYRFPFVDLNHKDLHLTFILRRNVFQKEKDIFALWLMFHMFLNSPQQDSTYPNNYQNYLHKYFKIYSELKPFILRWALDGRGAYSTTKILKRELYKKGICLRYSSIGFKNYRNLNYSLTESSFYVMVFNEKICKIKAFDLPHSWKVWYVSR